MAARVEREYLCIEPKLVGMLGHSAEILVRLSLDQAKPGSTGYNSTEHPKPDFRHQPANAGKVVFPNGRCDRSTWQLSNVFLSHRASTHRKLNSKLRRSSARSRRLALSLSVNPWSPPTQRLALLRTSGLTHFTDCDFSIKGPDGRWPVSTVKTSAELDRWPDRISKISLPLAAENAGREARAGAPPGCRGPWPLGRWRPKLKTLAFRAGVPGQDSQHAAVGVQTVFGWLKTERRERRRRVRLDRKYLEARSRRFLKIYLDADETRKPQFYRAVDQASKRCQPAESGLPPSELADAQIAEATSRAAMKIVLERTASKKDDRLADFLTNAYQRRRRRRSPASVYTMDKKMQELGTAAVHLLTMATSYTNAQKNEGPT